MATNESITVKDAVHKLQLSLLDGITREDQLFAAGSLLSKSDYEDVVQERSIAHLCGYPLCSNPLPSEQPKKGRYRISLSKHEVYDLTETYKYCSTSCVVNSRAFSASLQEERCSVLNPAKINQTLRLFEGLSSEDPKEGLGKNGDLGLSKLKIQEKTDVNAGEVSLEKWIGPSNAIEGYVPLKPHQKAPQKAHKSKTSTVGGREEGYKPNGPKTDKGKNLMWSDVGFESVIITQDEYSISKPPPRLKKTHSDAKDKRSKGKGNIKKQENQFNVSETHTAKQTDLERTSKGPKSGKTRTVVSNGVSSSDKDDDAVKADQLGETVLKSSLKVAGSNKQSQSVSWADERGDGAENNNLSEVREFEGTQKVSNDGANFPDDGDDNNSVRLASAEACVLALSQAAEAVSSGECDVSDAVSEAGIVILPPDHDVDGGKSQEDVDLFEEEEPTLSKWPTKPGVPNYNVFQSEDSWYDGPPEGFSLELSSFATMWMALFSWISSSSLAYIYGRDDSFHEEYSCVNGREYPRRIVLADGRSSEIKQTLAGCLSRALPGLITDLRLPTPLSVLEHGMGRLLDTMSFVDPLPAFRMKQWQVIALLFMDALSVSRVPALTPHMTSRRLLLQKVVDGARISAEEYEVMKDLMIPLGRVPELSTQCGG